MRVSFGAASYDVAEGGGVAVEVTLSAVPERTVTVLLTATNRGGAGADDYSGVPASVTFASGDTEQTFTLTATQDTVDDDGESVLLGFGDLPERVAPGATATSEVAIVDDDHPRVAVGFAEGAHSVAEGDGVVVEVTLSAVPERTVVIPITATGQNGAAAGDWSVAPASVTFDSGDASKAFTLTATQDTVDDDGESVLLGFGDLPDRVGADPAAATATVAIDDDDDPEVTVSFAKAAHDAAEGGEVTVTVTLSAVPERTVTIPITADGQNGAAAGDWSVAPASVTFESGDTSKTFTVVADDDDGGRRRRVGAAGLRRPA